MSSHATTVETGVTDASPTNESTTPSCRTRRYADLERRLLVERIEQLERELARERQRRAQVVEQYERELAEARSREAASESRDGDDGWLRGLF